jgi:hypothetical protein
MRRWVAAVAVGFTVLVGCSSKPAVVHDYDHVPVPAVPERTMQVAAGTGSLADGTYWAATVAVQSDDTVRLRITQALFGPACEGAGGTDCGNGYAPVVEPSRDITTTPTSIRSISVAAENRQNYAVTVGEWIRLVRNTSPSSTAASDYRYARYPYLVTIANGAVVELHQVWVPKVLEPQPGW